MSTPLTTPTPVREGTVKIYSGPGAVPPCHETGPVSLLVVLTEEGGVLQVGSRALLPLTREVELLCRHPRVPSTRHTRRVRCRVVRPELPNLYVPLVPSSEGPLPLKRTPSSTRPSPSDKPLGGVTIPWVRYSVSGLGPRALSHERMGLLT